MVAYGRIVGRAKGRAVVAQMWPDELDLDVMGIAQGGDGVGRWEGRAVFAAGALPGERVRVRLRDRQRAFARGHTVEVLRAAPERIGSPCPLQAQCGAADWCWIDYAAQLRFKAEILRDQLQHLGGIEIEVADVHGMRANRDERPRCAAGPGWSYRTTAELHVAGSAIGYYAPGSRRVARVSQCCLHHPLIDEALQPLPALLMPEMSLSGITVRCSPAQAAALAILDGDAGLDELAQRWMAQAPALQGVLLRRGRRVELLQGVDHLVQEIDGLRWIVSAGSFFQVNDRQTAVLIQRVVDLLQPLPGEHVLDLFCGVGAFALPLAKQGCRVTGIEIYAPAIDDARRSAELNAIDGTHWHAGPVEKVISQIAGEAGVVDAAVLDPPRRGCEPEALRALAGLGPQRIVYVACHPGTLARDCKLLIEAGYRVERAEVVDLFPQTHHVESVVLLRRAR